MTTTVMQTTNETQDNSRDKEWDKHFQPMIKQQSKTTFQTKVGSQSEWRENGTKFETKNCPPMSALLSGILRPVLSFGKKWDFENSRAH